MSERATFSPFWHRVRQMKPRLRPHVQVTRQHYRARRWHVVHDPASNQFYRLNPIAHDFLGTLDGTRDVESAWKLSLAKFGDAAPTQNEVIQLLSQLYNANLLAVDTTPETEQLLRRGRERLKKRIQQQAIGIMYFKIRLFNPDYILTKLEPILRPLINRWGLLAWAALVGWALCKVIPHFPELRAGFDSAIAPSNWGWLIVVWVVTKAIHETGHGVICKRFGGQVPEFGAMLLVLFPAPYVDASATWAFPNKWRRMAVGAGGMIFELAVASLCAFVWVSYPRGELVRQLAYNAMLTASISTVIFNANPLMRFDGYYILSDLLEVPNLAQRANKMLQYLAQKYLYRLERTTPPSSLPGEQATLFVYGLAAGAYRVFLFFSITLLLMGKMFGIGLFLAVWTAAAWFIIPVGVFVHWLASSPQLAEHRARAILTSIALAAGIFVLVGVVPMPDHRRAMGVIESRSRSNVAFGVDGFVEKVLVRPGDVVQKGQALVELASDELRAKRSLLSGQLDEYTVEERAARAKNDPAVVKIARERADVITKSLDDVQRKIGELTVRAPHDGTVVGGDPESLLGAYVKRGDRLCEVVDTRDIRVEASLDQAQGDWIRRLAPSDYSVRIRTVAYRDTGRIIPGENLTAEPAGQKVLPNAALGFAGGGKVEVESQDKSGRTSKAPRFNVRVDPVTPGSEDGSWVGQPGERVKLRFSLPSRPLLSQWIERLRIILLKHRPNI
jgi:putative peptide zinc metalloprotease protein